MAGARAHPFHSFGCCRNAPRSDQPVSSLVVAESEHGRALGPVRLTESRPSVSPTSSLLGSSFKGRTSLWQSGDWGSIPHDSTISMRVRLEIDPARPHKPCRGVQFPHPRPWACRSRAGRPLRMRKTGVRLPSGPLARSYRPTARTPDCRSGNAGSIPAGGANTRERSSPSGRPVATRPAGGATPPRVSIHPGAPTCGCRRLRSRAWARPTCYGRPRHHRPSWSQA
jgi:hypothetical protein